ncbi:transcriptional regulator, LysR family [Cystobacter fuscus DSM 2262]|uniref:Transcriptional regulator, LysR family n=1 Tax=Cystobacter fuscus (strain ATCC 25194 / DSM 2262 / NBRC 100088 / M29) TaxID=1242864 RepID=S9PLX7_CYSF2|nr:LysR substrate-binding domain-containing protein [Cystobacter fuscus]EPX64011.1 transcriptional regulator, LysR family [Cystobacter fuscus DSM 2262]
MDAAELKVFEAVARTGGIGRAAQELHTVQSNVTARIRRLEEELGVPLFDRHSRGVKLTSAGERLLPYATQAERLMSEARQAVADGPEPHGTLSLGSLETTAALRLTPILVAYTRECPQVDVSLRTGTTQGLVADVLEHRLEGAFVAGPVRHRELLEEPVVTEELVLVTAPGVRLEDLPGMSGGPKVLVFRTGCTYRQHLEHFLASRGLKALRTLELGTLDGILGCVSAGMGLTLLPRAVVEAAWRAGSVAVHALPASRSRVTTVFIRRREGFTSRALLRFIDCAQRIHGGR